MFKIIPSYSCKGTSQNQLSPELAYFNFNFNLFSVHLIHRGLDPSDMELVNTEIRLQMSYMK